MFTATIGDGTPVGVIMVGILLIITAVGTVGIIRIMDMAIIVGTVQVMAMVGDITIGMAQIMVILTTDTIMEIMPTAMVEEIIQEAEDTNQVGIIQEDKVLILHLIGAVLLIIVVVYVAGILHQILIL